MRARRVSTGGARRVAAGGSRRVSTGVATRCGRRASRAIDHGLELAALPQEARGGLRAAGQLDHLVELAPAVLGHKIFKLLVAAANADHEAAVQHHRTNLLRAELIQTAVEALKVGRNEFTLSISLFEFSIH